MIYLNKNSFPQQNSSQILIKNFLKSGQVISGHSVSRTLFSGQTSLFSLFFFFFLSLSLSLSLQLVDTINNFEAILVLREKEHSIF